MKCICLNGARMTDREKTHAYLKERLSLPDYYGGNLDALADCLGERPEPGKILFYNTRSMEKHLGEYGAKLLSVFRHAACGENGLRLVCKRGVFR